MSETIPTVPAASAADGGIVEGLYRVGAPVADAAAPAGPIDKKWTTRKFEAHLVNPANRRLVAVFVQPRVCAPLHTPWNRCIPNATMAMT